MTPLNINNMSPLDIAMLAAAPKTPFRVSDSSLRIQSASLQGSTLSAQSPRAVQSAPAVLRPTSAFRAVSELSTELPRVVPAAIQSPKPIRSSHTDASTQTETQQAVAGNQRNDAATQYNSADFTRAIQSSLAEPDAQQYPLENIGFTIRNPDLAPRGVPEREPYYGQERENFWPTTYRQVALMAANTGMFVAKLPVVVPYKVITGLFNAILGRETEFEMLFKLHNRHQEIRVTETWFGNPQREGLYSLYDSWFHTIFVNTFKRIWLEKGYTSRKPHMYKMMKVIPHVVRDHLNTALLKHDQKFEKVIRKAAVVLTDPTGYNNGRYLVRLEKELTTLITHVAKQTSQFRQLETTNENIFTTLQRIRQGFENRVGDVFPANQRSVKEHNKLNPYFVLIDRTFEVSDAFAKEFSEKEIELKAKLQNMPKATLADVKKRVQLLAQGLIDLRNSSHTLIDEFDISLAES